MCLLGGLCFTLEFVLLMLARSLACCCSLVVCLREGMGFGSAGVCSGDACWFVSSSKRRYLVKRGDQVGW